MSLKLAQGHVKSGEYSLALDVFRSMLSDSSYTNYAAAAGAGRCAGALKNFSEAAEFYELAAHLEPTRYEPKLELANLYYRMREFSRSLISLDAAEKLTTPNEKIHLLRNRLLNELGEFQQLERLALHVLQGELTLRQRYSWEVRHMRALFYQGDLTNANKCAAERLRADKEACEFRHSEHEISVDVILNCYQRTEAVRFQRWWLEYQSIKPKRFLVWHNFGGGNQSLIAGADNARNDKNHKFYGRFAYALLSQAEYLAVFDDDTVPGTCWLANCLHVFREKQALLGTIGVTLLHSDKYAPNVRTGWIGDGQEALQEVDLVGHGWFFPRDWLRYFWYERPSTFETGEDMHLSFAVQKHLDIGTTVPPHPAANIGMWGSVLGEELGSDLAASSSQKGKTHYSERDYCVQDLVQRGWKLINGN